VSDAIFELAFNLCFVTMTFVLEISSKFFTKRKGEKNPFLKLGDLNLFVTSGW
jgi:hypothetical protein